MGRSPESGPAQVSGPGAFLLLLSVFVIAICGLVYELVSGALASYLLGDSVTQFSTVIGVYLFSMGIGSYLSRHVHGRFIAVFIQVEILIGLVGGGSAALLFGLFDHVGSFRVLLYFMVGLIGTLVGLEVPLLMRILGSSYELRDLVSKVFTFDYVGALVASLLFPLVLVPHLGLVRSCFLFGICNVVVALWALHLFEARIAWVRRLQLAATLALIALGLGFAYSDRLVNIAEESTYGDRILYSKSSPYQRIVLTRSVDDFRLYLNGHLQFSSRDEYRYHEALVHPGLEALDHPRRALVMGGGDGMAVREILKVPTIESVTLVDLDPMMTHLFTTQEVLSRLNAGSFRSPKVRVINTDAFLWLRANRERFDFVVVDFPDPSNYSVGKLYTTAFFRELHRALNEGGAVVVQSTSPLFARKSFWCIHDTLEAVDFKVTPYHAYIPSFGEWGYNLATFKDYVPPTRYITGLKFVSPLTTRAMLDFPPDMAPIKAGVNRLNNQILVRYYDSEWSEYAR